MSVEETKTAQGVVTATTSTDSDDNLSTPAQHDQPPVDNRSSHVPWTMKVLAVVLVSSIGFGSHWSSGVTGAMKATLKKELDINNTQYAVLTGSKDFMVTVLILFTGLLTDRIGGAGAMLYGNAIYSVGTILVAAACQVRSYKFMVSVTSQPPREQLLIKGLLPDLRYHRRIPR